MIEPNVAVLPNCYIGAPLWASVLYNFDVAVCPICVIGASLWDAPGDGLRKPHCRSSRDNVIHAEWW